MVKLEYQVKFSRSDLSIKIVELLGNTLPNISTEDKYRLADESIGQIIRNGNYPLFRGLVMYCTDIATRNALKKGLIKTIL